MRRSPWFHNGFLLRGSQSGEREEFGGVRDRDGFGEFFSGVWDGPGHESGFGRFGNAHGGSRRERTDRFLGVREQFFLPVEADFFGAADDAVHAVPAEFTAADCRARDDHRHTGAERDDFSCGGRDGCDRRPVPLPLGSDIDQPVGPGARDLADVRRVPAGDALHAAASDVPGAEPGNGTDHGVAELVWGDAAVHHADGGGSGYGAVRGDDRCGVSVRL